MLTADDPKFQAIIDSVARQLVIAEHRSGGSFIRTPLLYPSGAQVVVRIQDSSDHYFVSDIGLGYQEAEMMGASQIYTRQAVSIAEQAGVRFDSHAFFILEASKDQLPGAVATIANCSNEATVVTAYKLATRKYEDDSELLYNRLVNVFSPKAVARRAEVIGSSNTKWRVAAMVRLTPNGRSTLFEPVANHHSSIAHATMKFQDIARLDSAPGRVAVVQNKRQFGTYLNVLSQAANVIDERASNAIILRLAA